ncbi:MAG: molecular chaperone TorD family protein [Trichlorobacter sp.]|uniref:TorD/DmsD family molecular chaperone n=1 Tax=Trichlorobacter sp. TaxID=2911007 RepID=UPI00256CFBC2|nr:molecular chaperone TorD family protein [Trichlorobacter sp.]MDK9719516.1 molecular chaperone TorD family protein [Trichlorobacter sp.]
METCNEDIYRLLAACFYPPAPALLEEGCCTNLAALLASSCPHAAQQATEAARLLHDADPQELLVEYSRLFLGPFKLVAPPYGSVWLDQSKAVMGESTARVAAFYQSHGLQLAEDFPELPDHITAELEFLSYLAFRQREATTAGDNAGTAAYIQAQQEFLASFLLPWLTLFCEAISDDGEAPFYAAIAQCTLAFTTAQVTDHA